MTPRERFPVLSAALVYTLAVAVAFWPFWTGHFLINSMSDMRNGYPFRLFEAEYLHHVGGFPQWNCNCRNDRRHATTINRDPGIGNTIDLRNSSTDR